MRQNKFFMKKKNTTDKDFANIEEGVSKTEQFVEKNWKIWGSIIGLLISILLAISYIKIYIKPPETKQHKTNYLSENNILKKIHLD